MILLVEIGPQYPTATAPFTRIITENKKHAQIDLRKRYTIARAIKNANSDTALDEVLIVPKNTIRKPSTKVKAYVFFVFKDNLFIYS